MTTTHPHLASLTEALASLDDALVEVAAMGRDLFRRLDAGHRLLAVGNGGSAAPAQHLTAELVGRYREDRAPYSAICLSAETSSLTAIANDYPPEELFARQVAAHGRPGDVLVALSTSGSSRNAVEAAQRGVDAGLEVWAITGRAPNPLSRIAHRTLAVDSASTATVQEVHLVLLHLLCEHFDEACFEQVEAVTAR
ncbi:SIS domain-containing protein [Aeromicrobium sp. Marseille-Q0843]|uniref:SIS domain-containing protein n=1 Tax=Aeromicrobium phoceense TaxID=2754045 RepID=A0A838XH06_9ACTN|nr:SIS domain-containing protein [Aeromicrobium phoceense]MBA4609865.1 SIS domain-containing protein [Aeromicrobium phoceense]